MAEAFRFRLISAKQPAASAVPTGPHCYRAAAKALTALLVACAALVFSNNCSAAFGDPPGRVGRLAQVEGQVWLYDNDQAVWLQVQRNWPITNGDRLTTDADSRAEIRIGSTSLRLGPDSDLEAAQLDDERIELQLHDGSLALRVRAANVAREIGVTTTEGRFEPDGVGSFRVDRRDDASEATVWRGVLRFQAADRGLTLTPGRRARLTLEGPWRATRVEWRRNEVDSFADWVLRADESDPDRAVPGSSAALVSAEMTGWEDLDRYGRWQRDRDFGMVWLPSGVEADWAPYRDGQWVYARPWGWTWVDDAPWGFAPFHFGRWVFARDRWAWSPGEYVHRPNFAPALVGWVGPPPRWHDNDRRPPPPQSWVPLAPGEHFRPWQPQRGLAPQAGRDARDPGRDRSRDVPRDNASPGRETRPGNSPPAGFANQAVKGAVTQVPSEDVPWRWPAPRMRTDRNRPRIDESPAASAGARTGSGNAVNPIAPEPDRPALTGPVGRGAEPGRGALPPSPSVGATPVTPASIGPRSRQRVREQPAAAAAATVPPIAASPSTPAPSAARARASRPDIGQMPASAAAVNPASGPPAEAPRPAPGQRGAPRSDITAPKAPFAPTVPSVATTAPPPAEAERSLGAAQRQTIPLPPVTPAPASSAKPAPVAPSAAPRGRSGDGRKSHQAEEKASDSRPTERGVAR
jgi:hypothetical protein